VKRLLPIAVSLFAIVLLAVFGNVITAQMLDQRLAPLLSQQLGVAVTLAPTSANLLGLRASTPRLVMGDSGAPAIVAENVSVRLDLRALLGGEIRLAAATASWLEVSVSRWPRKGGPLPENYRFLDPWLPGTIDLDKGRYLAGDGSEWPIERARWERLARGAALLEWHERRGGSELRAQARLASLEDLLALRDFQLELAIDSGPGSEDLLDSSWRVQPQGEGYALQTGFTLDGGPGGEFRASQETAWRWPATLALDLGRVSLSEVRRLPGRLSRNPQPFEFSRFLDSLLPGVDFPPHEGRVTIAEIAIGDESLINTVLDYRAAGPAVELTRFSTQGPAGNFDIDGNALQQQDGWLVSLNLDLRTWAADRSLAAQFLDDEWHWQSGSVSVVGRGSSWGELLYSARGEIDLGGFHRGSVDTPVRVGARIQGAPDLLGVEDLQLRLGRSLLTGGLSLSGEGRRLLDVELDASGLDLDFLFSQQGGPDRPGVAIPEYLGSLPGIDVNWRSRLDGLKVPGLALSSVDLDFQRDAGSGVFRASAAGPAGGPLVVEMRASGRGTPHVSFDMLLSLEQVNLERLFGQQQTVLDSRASGRIHFESEGADLVSIFQSMAGDAQLDIAFRGDGDWQRSSRADEAVSLGARARLVLDGEQIVGLSFDELNLESLEQEVTGSLSLVTGRDPWLVAELEAPRLSVDSLASWLPESSDEADRSDFLATLRDLGPVDLNVRVADLRWFDTPLSQVEVKLASRPALFNVETLNFATAIGRVGASASLTWSGDVATFSAVGGVAALTLENFLQPDRRPVPLVGSVRLKSSGTRLAEMLQAVEGEATLQSDPGQGDESVDRRRLALGFQWLDDTLSLDVKSLQYGVSELAGTVRYRHAEVPDVDVELSRGNLSLLPWESPVEEAASPEAGPGEGALSRAARISGQLVSGVLGTPARMLEGARRDEEQVHLFSSDTIDLAWLRRWNGSISGRLQRLESREGLVRDLDFGVRLRDARLEFDASADDVNGGSAEVHGVIDDAAARTLLKLGSTFEDVHADVDRTSYPRSGFLELNSHGRSVAELAAGLEGQSYLALGRGPIELDSIAFLSRDVASTVLSALLPGASGKPQQQELRCAVAVFEFRDNLAYTPYGFVARTDRVNIIGQLEANLTDESLRMEFDARSRKGAGLSVGNVFSSTVRVAGTLARPQVVPRTAGLLWRGWAAVMTGGLSILGESVLKRMLTSSTPCEDVTREIRKNVCSSDVPAAQSPLVCPG
jgi:hypothetical protein